MPRIRQSDPVVIRTFAVRHSAPYTIPAHTHTWSQLIYSHAGAITVHTAAGSWVVPPERGVWVPAGMTHSIEMSGQVSMRSLYFAPGIPAGLTRRRLPKACSVVNISPLLRELILHASGGGGLDRPHSSAGSSDRRDSGSDLHPRPSPAAAVRAARHPRRACGRDTSERSGGDSIARSARAGNRSQQTDARKKISSRNRHGARPMASTTSPVAGAAPAGGGAGGNIGRFGSGYQSTSAFISMFKKAMGSTPFRYRAAYRSS